MSPTNAAPSEFTWIPFYSELADRLLSCRTRQAELVEFAESLRRKGLKLTSFVDRDKTGRQFPMVELDPFTFFGCFNRQLTEENRIAILREMRSFFGLQSQLPTDFAGVPILNNQNSWFFAFQSLRKSTDIEALWDVFALARQPRPLDDPRFAAAFDAALEVRGTSNNLTIGLFWIRPDVFLSFDGTMRRFLGLRNPPGGLSFESYLGILNRVRTEHPGPLAELSLQAWKAADDVPADQVEKSDVQAPIPSQEARIAPGIEYWLVGAYWDSESPQDRTDLFIQEGIWKNGYEDKYLDQVRSMKVGDRIAIKTSFTRRGNLPFDSRGHTVSCLTLKARGTVVRNLGDGRTVDVEWETAFKQKTWYFYTLRGTIWRLRQENQWAQKLIQFAFFDARQDYPQFVAAWWDRPQTDQTDDPIGPGAPSAYAVADMLDEGVFLPEESIQLALRRLEEKRNLILQGAPGVGKTFVAKRLAYALLEAADDTRVEFVQFHPSYSYEDFVRGYRPTEHAGQFELRDGPFVRFCERAAATPEQRHVLIIDEINRGNLSQVFGELFMLLDADKRGPRHALTPLYQRTPDERFVVPSNLFVIGTMNIADRSLALVDFALRRRFAFMTLEPRFGDPRYRRWMHDRKAPEELTVQIFRRMTELNDRIAADRRLGPAFRIGHSFFCPRGDDLAHLNMTWFNEVVGTEIEPLLNEYWYDEPDKVRSALDALLA